MGNGLKVILTNQQGNEIKYLKNYSVDIDINKSMDFELNIPTETYDNDYKYWTRIFIPNTEYGGLIGGREIETLGETIKFTGMTWRGYLNKHIIEPLSGEDYRIVSGELNTILANFVNEFDIGSIFVVPDIDTGITVSNFQFNRYTSLYKGITKLYESVGYKLNIAYKEKEGGDIGYVEIQAVPIIDYSESIELSQNSKLNFKIKEIVDGINHLICLGQGDLRERQVIHLYLQEDGTIGDIQYYFGIDEIAEIYDYPNAESAEDLRKYGIERFKEKTSYKSLEVEVAELTLDVNVGDIIGGRDYVTGTYLFKPVTNKVFKSTNDVFSIEYSIEGDDADEEVQ